MLYEDISLLEKERLETVPMIPSALASGVPFVEVNALVIPSP